MFSGRPGKQQHPFVLQDFNGNTICVLKRAGYRQAAYGSDLMFLK
jgi:hypothetical protein